MKETGIKRYDLGKYIHGRTGTKVGRILPPKRTEQGTTHVTITFRREPVDIDDVNMVFEIIYAEEYTRIEH